MEKVEFILIVFEVSDFLFKLVKLIEDAGDLADDILLLLFAILDVAKSLLIEVVLQE